MTPLELADELFGPDPPCGHARGFAQGIAYAKAREHPVPAADDPGVAREAPGPERGGEAGP